jgi:predicted transcriptional regulator
MPRPPPSRPTDAELAILRILWASGSAGATVRAVHEEIARTRPPGYSRPAGYTSVLKLMQIMVEKGLVTRDEAERSHIYHAVATESHTQRQLVRDLLDRAFGGSARAMILHALSARRASPEDLAEIQRLIDEHRQSAKQRGDR